MKGKITAPKEKLVHYINKLEKEKSELKRRIRKIQLICSLSE